MFSLADSFLAEANNNIYKVRGEKAPNFVLGMWG